MVVQVSERSFIAQCVLVGASRALCVRQIASIVECQFGSFTHLKRKFGIWLDQDAIWYLLGLDAIWCLHRLARREKFGIVWSVDRSS